VNLQPFLAELHRRDVRLTVDGDRLRCKAPAGVLTAGLRDQLKERKSEILALLRSAQAVALQPQAVVPLQPRGKRTPVFAVPGHYGDVFGYRALALRLGDDQPFFGLEPPGLDGASAPLTKVEDLAAYFAAQILAVQPTGPLIIAGHCAGGAIAFELAQQLRQRGASIHMLVLFACPYPTFYRFAPQLKQAIVQQVQRIGRHARALTKLSFPQARQYIAAKLRRLQGERDAGHAAMADPVLVRRAVVSRATVAAIRRYTPVGYAGRVSLILPNRAWLRSGAEPLRWRSVAPQAEHSFGPDECNPDLLLMEPDAGPIADLFGQRLATLAAETASSTCTPTGGPMRDVSAATQLFSADATRATYLAKNAIAVGPPGDPEEFRREYERFEHLLPQRRPLRVLDIGCGTGAWSVHWVARGGKVTGVDFDPEFIARAKSRENLGDTNVFLGIVADAARLPPDIGEFDVVLHNSLLEHVPDWRAVIKEAVRVLAPGGVLLLHTTNRHHPFQGEVNHFPFYSWLPGPIRDRVLAWIMKHRRDLVNYTDFPAVHWFSYPDLSRVLRNAGLEVYDRLDLMRPEQLTGVRSMARWMVPGRGRRARGKFLFYLVSPGVSLYARRPRAHAEGAA
jgi:thioesterase domain-containing protein/SAM-dependent methyltransferase